MNDAAPNRPLSFLAAAGWTLLVSFLMQLVLVVTDAVHPGALTNLVSIATCTALAHLIVLFAILRVHAPNGSIRDVLALRKPRVSSVVLAAIVGAGLSPLASWLNRALEQRFPPSPEETAILEKVFTTNTLGERIAIGVVLVLVMPACEELFFRGVLFTSLRKAHSDVSVLLATAAYDVLMSGANVRMAGPALLLALVLGGVRIFGASVIPSVVCCMAFYAVSTVPVALGRPEPSFGLHTLVGGVLASAAAFLILFVLHRKDARSATFDDERVA